MKLILAIFIFVFTFVDLGYANQQTVVCKEVLTQLSDAEGWMTLIQKSTQKYLPAESLSAAQLQSTKSFSNLQSFLEKLSKKPESFRPRDLEKLISKLYVVSNDPLNRIIPASALEKNSIGAQIHEELFKKMARQDIGAALEEMGLLKGSKVKSMRSFLNRRSQTLRLALWTSIHVPLALFHQYYPLYLPNIGKFKVSRQIEELVEKNLEHGDYNAALALVEPELKKAYGNIKHFNYFYGLTRKLYNHTSLVWIAHILLTSGVSQHYLPELSSGYQEVTAPVIAAFEREFSDRQQLEELTIQAVLEQKEDVLGYKTEIEKRGIEVIWASSQIRLSKYHSSAELKTYPMYVVDQYDSWVEPTVVERTTQIFQKYEGTRVIDRLYVAPEIYPDAEKILKDLRGTIK